MNRVESVVNPPAAGCLQHAVSRAPRGPQATRRPGCSQLVLLGTRLLASPAPCVLSPSRFPVGSLDAPLMVPWMLDAYVLGHVVSSQ